MASSRRWIRQKKFHGLGPYDPETGETSIRRGRRRTRRSLPSRLTRLADSGNDKRRRDYGGDAEWDGARSLPAASIRSATFDVGIAEEHAVDVRGGHGDEGLSSRSARSTRRSCSARYDQIVHDVCLQNLPVVFCMDRGGLSGDDGPTHHGSVRHQLPAERCLTSCTWCRSDEDDARRHDVYGDRCTKGRRPSEISAWDGAGLQSVKDEGRWRSTIGKAEVLRGWARMLRCWRSAA